MTTYRITLEIFTIDKFPELKKETKIVEVLDINPILAEIKAVYSFYNSAENVVEVIKREII